MSGENRNSTTPPPQIYTVYSVQFQGNGNPGFQGCHPHDPPPKYEDVISGEYLKSDYSSYNHSSPLTTVTNFHSVGPNGHCNCSRINSAQSEGSFDENERNTKCGTGCSVICICVLIGLFVWRVILLAKF